MPTEGTATTWEPDGPDYKGAQRTTTDTMDDRKTQDWDFLNTDEMD